ncbi:MAG: LamG domain-containing protein [Planctomycetia bacterium]|nr:LamG domain-containing protein [Planctomycetia bacterium]
MRFLMFALLLSWTIPAFADDGLIAHWPLKGDFKDRGPHALHLRSHGGELSSNESTGTRFDGRDDWLEAPIHDALKLGMQDFTVSMWINIEKNLDDVPGDLLSQFDAAQRRGFQLSVKSHAVTASQANTRTLHFGIDNNHIEPTWTDHGQVGQSMFVKALAVFDGKLFAGTCEPGKDRAGHVYRFDGGTRWVDCGSPAPCNSVSAFAVLEGKLYAGVSKYRLAGSALSESENANLGGRVFRYDGESRWIDCGQLPETEGIGGMAVFQGKLFAGSLYKPAGFFRYDGEQKWTAMPLPNGKRVEAMCVHNNELFASSYDEAHIYRFNGETWTDCGQVGETTNTQTYSFAIHNGRMYVGTWRTGKVFRYDGDNHWADCGRLGEELEVMGMLVHNGSLFAGSLPLAEVFRYRTDTDPRWDSVGRVDLTPNVMYRRAWTMSEFQGRLFVGTLPSGRVLSIAAGANVTDDRSLPSGWQHLAAQRSGKELKLFVNGRLAATSTSFEPAQYDLSSTAALRIGSGPTDYFNGQLRDIRLHRRVLTLEEIRSFAQ